MPSTSLPTRLHGALRRVDAPRPLLGALLFVVAFAIYSGCLSHEFVMDDNFHVLSNTWIKSPKHLPEIFSSSLWSYEGGNTSLYRPLIHVLFMATYALFGSDPMGFHLLNLLLHAGATVFFFRVASEILRRQPSTSPAAAVPAAFGAALLFATHPIHCENVAWVSGVMDVACAFFFLCALTLYGRADGGGGWRYWLSMAAFFLATLCKEPALLLAPAFVGYDWAVSRGPIDWRRRIPRYVPLLIVLVAYSLMRVYALGGVAPVTHGANLTPYEYALNACVLFGRYLAIAALPVGLNVWHVFEPVASIATTAGALGVASAAAFAVCLGITARRSRVACLGQLLFVLPLLPALYIPGLTQGIENAFAERYLYLPSIGFALVAAALLAWIAQRRAPWPAIGALALAATLGAYSIATVRRAAVWRDAPTLWSDAAAKSPQSGTPHFALGDAYRDRDAIDRAIEEYRLGLGLMPYVARVHADLGMLYARKGWIDEGIQQLQLALALEPEHPVAHNYLAIVYGNLGLHEQAISQLQRAIELHPRFQLAYRHLGIAYYNAGRVQESIAPLERAIELDPDDADAHNNLGVSYAVLGFWDRALAHFERAVALAPDDPAARANLQRALQMAPDPRRDE
ncbi:MAG TPA: tetratricopeptide repeat protein [Myxococcota bacterium]